MLQLQVVMSESYDEETQEFIEETWSLKLEHSLVSLSKWESKFEKPFLSGDDKTEIEIVSYIGMMDLADETPPEVFQNITSEQYEQINAHINAKMTATWFNRITKSTVNRQVVTSELIYYWMTSYDIPWVAEAWHLNRLFTLIEVFNEERSTSENKNTNKKSGNSLAAERRALNEKRKREMGSSG